MDGPDLASLRSAFEAASSYSEYCTIAVTFGVFIEFVALFVFSKEMPKSEKIVMAFATAVIVLGCGGEFIFGSRASDAAAQLQQASDRQIAGLTKETVRLTGEVATARAAVAGAQAETAKTNEAVAKANERAAILEKRAASESLRAAEIMKATAWRALMPEQIEKLSRSISAHSGKLNIAWVANDAESLALAIQFSNIFAGSKWELTPTAMTYADRVIWGNLNPRQ